MAHGFVSIYDIYAHRTVELHVESIEQIIHERNHHGVRCIVKQKGVAEGICVQQEPEDIHRRMDAAWKELCELRGWTRKE